MHLDDNEIWGSAISMNLFFRAYLEEFYQIRSYKAHWDLMVGEGSTLDETTLLGFTYRNFDDYSIWQYTAEMFLAMDSDDDSAISFEEFGAWK